MEKLGGIPNANLLQNFNTKERSVNFSNNEIFKLQALVEKSKNILMCKKTDGTSTKQKEQTWSIIEKEFNATGQIPRTMKQLKYKFENMKRTAKKEATRERQEMVRTGGGKPPSLPPGSEDATDWLRSMMSTSIDGVESHYDDDVITPNSDSVHNVDHNFVIINSDVDEITLTQKKPKLDNSVTVLMDADYETDNVPQNAEMVEKPSCIGQITEKSFDCSTPHSSLRRPIAPQLRRQIQKKQHDNNIIKRKLREQKMSVLKDINDLEMEKIRQSIHNHNELHKQLMLHNEEKHKLELEKLKLENEVLKSLYNAIDLARLSATGKNAP